jgi:hypothetical protein
MNLEGASEQVTFDCMIVNQNLKAGMRHKKTPSQSRALLFLLLLLLLLFLIPDP